MEKYVVSAHVTTWSCLTPWRLCHSFDAVLDYSKLSAGDFTLDVQPNVDLQSTLDSVTTAIQMKADTGGRGLWVRSYIGTNVPQWYETDAKRLQQILYNLLVSTSYFVLMLRFRDNNFV